MENKLAWNNFYKHPRFWRHVLAWAIFLSFIILAMGVENLTNPEESLSEELKGHSLPTFLLEIFVLIYASVYAYDRLIPQRKFKWFFLSLVLVIVIVAAVDDYLDTMSIVIGDLTGFLANVVVMPAFLVVAFGIKLSYRGARQLFVINRLEAQQMESELKLLKSQINPHFLFNTLNNIYSANLEDQEKANDIILELADLLRYQLESNKKTKATLQEEIKSLENYIELEKIRVKECEVTVNKSGDMSRAEIVPLLLLPFVENAFKYGTGIEPGKIDIDFTIDEAHLFTFACKNKIVQKKGRQHSGGIGLENVKKRLALVYNNNYQLDIKNEDQYFTVNLIVQL